MLQKLFFQGFTFLILAFNSVVVAQVDHVDIDGIRFFRTDISLVPHGVTLGTFDIVSGDLNDDQKEDLVIAFVTGFGGSRQSNFLSLLAEGFGTPPKFQVVDIKIFEIQEFGRALDLGLADFDGDLKEDIVAAASDGFGLFLGGGDGTFDFSATTTGGDGGLQLSDFNNDGETDLAVVNVVSATIKIFLNNGTGAFQLSQTIQTPRTGTTAITTIDFNNDNNTDIVFSNLDRIAKLYSGNGQGLFTFQGSFQPIQNDHPIRIVSGDFNSDGNEDLAFWAVNFEKLKVFLGSGTGQFVESFAFGAGGRDGRGLTVGDLNADSNLDIITTTHFNGVFVFLGDGMGSFSSPLKVLGEVDPFVTSPIWSVLTADFSNDGIDDLAVIHGRGVTILYTPIIEIVEIDIKPQSDPNCINLGSEGVVPVAILGSSTLDVATIDLTTLEFAGHAAKQKGRSGKIGSLEDVNDDGFADLVVQFQTQDLNLTEMDTEASLSGFSLDGPFIEGTDAICVVPAAASKRTLEPVDSTTPQLHTLQQNYPNPFNPETEIRFQVPNDGHVLISVYNTLGQEIRRLADQHFAAGFHTVHWDGKNDRGAAVASGVYVYQMRAGGFTQERKMSLLR